jgi:hypothetical protein
MKITPKTEAKTSTITVKTTNRNVQPIASKWWAAKSKGEMFKQLISTFEYLKTNQTARQREAAIYARLYGNMPLMNFIGNNGSAMSKSALPVDRPTFNLVQSATDTLVARIGQSKPTPVFLTDNSDYKERKLAKQLNSFILGEFYQLRAYEKAVICLRDSLVEGTGCAHVYQNGDRVGLERVLLTELFVDPNEAMYGEPRTLYRMKLVDRGVLKEMFSDKNSIIDSAQRSFPDNSADASKSTSDLVMVVESWRLPNGRESGDGMHIIACDGGILQEGEYNKDRFPFAFIHYSPRLLGFWAQGLAEQLMGTQIEINRLLVTISRSINLVGVPRVLLETGSKINKAQITNNIGAVIEYQGTPPVFQAGDSGIAPDIYAQLQRLIEYGYQQSGVSMMQASSTKPQGLDSGEAIRSYNDIASDRFATLAKRYDDFFVDLAYLIIDTAKDVAESEGKYSTIYPNKDGTKEIDLPKASLLEDPFVIQCFTMSSLPRDPAGRMQKIIEMMQANMISVKEGRRLLDFPDLSQVEKLANAAEERIYQILDAIVEEGEFTAPDTFMDLMLAKERVVQYINLYEGAKLEEERMQLLRDFFTQVNDLITQAQAPAAPMSAPVAGDPATLAASNGLAVPEAPPTSDMIPMGSV